LRADDLALADLAASVADGTAIDWHDAETQAGNARRLVRHLRLVESIASLHRSIAAEPADTPAPQVPEGRRWGRLVLGEQIGQGTSCDVYRARDTDLDRDVALKLLHADQFETHAPRDGQSAAHVRVLDEARRLARLRHEHIVQVYGAEAHDGRVGLWMELVQGTSLERVVEERGPLGAREAALIGLDVCAALSAVHGAGLLHRDVKAQNVMREAGGRIVLMDFGTGEELAGTNRIVGTPLYLAPEIFKGHKASIQSDVYSVGVLLYYLVTGRFPVNASSIEHLARVHAKQERQPLRDLRADAPEAFVRAVERALDPDPARRYRTVGELEAALRDAIVPAPAGVDGSSPSRARGAARWLRLPYVAIAASLALVIAALIVWTRSPEPGFSTPGVTRVAVLPFRDLSTVSTPPSLADALTDQLISTLGQIRSIQVTSLSSVLQFKNGAEPIPLVARRLRVDDVVEGTLTVTQAPDGKPDRVRIRARLVAAGTDSTIWSQEFERSFGDTLGLQSDVARAIAEGIRAVLTPEEHRRLEPARPTTPEANEAYFLGLHYLSRSSSDAQKAVDAFRRATTLDPDHAGAHAGLARGLMALGFVGSIFHQEARTLASAEVQRAIGLDPDSSEAHAVLADLQFYYDWDWAGAESSYQRAIALNTSFARARSQYARYLAAAGRGQESIDEATRASDLEPTSASAVSTRALMQYYARDYAAAMRTIDHALRLEPAAASLHFVRARVLAARGEIDEAIASNGRALELSEGAAAPSWRAHQIMLEALAGRRDAARSALAALRADAHAANARLGGAHLAYVHEALGERDAALTLFERAANERDPDILWLSVDPRVDVLRQQPRFVQVLARVSARR
jgi:serine/threonine protein kinase/Tfp pilus assembly protein PilF